MNAKHTPTPWSIVPQNDGSSIIAKMHEDASKGFRIVCHAWLRRDSQAEDQANAAFIVRAVNAHDDLVAALSNLVAIIEDGNKATTESSSYACARAALAKARGE